MALAISWPLGIKAVASSYSKILLGLKMKILLTNLMTGKAKLHGTYLLTNQIYFYNPFILKCRMPYCQFLSHEQEFDYLKSLEIEAKINDIKFVPHSNSCNNCIFMLSTNDKSVKLWKINESNQNSYIPAARESYIAEGGLTLPKRSKNPISATNLSPSTQLCSTPFGDRSVTASCKRLYHHVHAYHINSISLNSDGETFLSADDLRVNLWNFEQR